VFKNGLFERASFWTWYIQDHLRVRTLSLSISLCVCVCVCRPKATCF
jgi:hypothetical protein